MPKSPAERKAAQRARQSTSGTKSLVLQLNQQEIDILAHNCAARRPGRYPYSLAEYITLLILQDDARVKNRFRVIRKNRCTRCGDQLPVHRCPLQGEAACWATSGRQTLKLTV